MQSAALKVSKAGLLRASRAVLLGLLVGEVLIGLIYLGSLLWIGEAPPLFDLNRQLALPSCLQALHLLAIGAIAITFSLLHPRGRGRPSRNFLNAIALLCLYGAVDEIFKIHLQTDRWFPALSKEAWIVFYICTLIAIPTVFHRDFRALWQQHRSECRWVLLGVGIFALGGFGAEIFRFVSLELLLNSPNPLATPALTAASVDLSEALRIAFEECLEVMGESVVLYGVLLFSVNRLAPSNRMASPEPDSKR